MSVAVRTGIPVAEWLDHPEDLFTAVEVLADMNRKGG